MRIPPHLFPMSRIPRLAGYVLMAAAVLMAVLARRGLDKIGPVPSVAIILLIGMVAFVANYPNAPWDGGFSDPATALPVQVYSWASRSDPAFIERSNGAIIVLLVFLLIMNVTAIILRRRFERRW